MATNPVNLVDAVATVVPRLARNRSAVVRFGRVASAPSAGVVSVTLSGVNVTCNYVAGFTLAVNDWVAMLLDGDRWVVLGKVVPTTGLQGAMTVSAGLAVTGGADITGGLDVLTGAITLPAGDIVVGDGTVTSARSVWVDRLIGTSAVRGRFVVSTVGADGPQIEVWVAGAMQANFAFDQDGQIWAYTASDAEYRPLPWAFQVGTVAVSFSSDTAKVTTVNFSGGRFTKAPMVVSTPTGASSFYAYNTTATAASVGLGLSQRDGVAITGSVDIQWHAIQATAGAGAGPALADARAETGMEVNDVLTVCRTSGCENFGKEILSRVYTSEEQPDPDVVCGVCSQRCEFVAGERS